MEKEELAVIEGTDDAENSKFHDAEVVPTLNISRHALTSISSMASTFTLRLKVDRHTALALVDSGSDASFTNAKFALKSKCNIISVPTTKVPAANGKEITSATACLSCHYTIQGQEFNSDLRLLLEVQGRLVDVPACRLDQEPQCHSRGVRTPHGRAGDPGGAREAQAEEDARLSCHCAHPASVGL